MTKKTAPLEAIRFSATIYGIRTTVDGGANVTLSLSGKEIEALTQLLQIRQMVGVILEVAAVPVKNEKLTDIDNAPKKEAKRSSTRVDRRRFAD